MKKIALLLGLLASMNAHGQKWEIGGNSGILIDAHGNKLFPPKGGTKNVVSSTSGIRILRNIGRMQAGMAIDIMTLDGGTADARLSLLYYVGQYYAGTVYSYNGDPDARLKTAAPAVPVQLFANLTFPMYKLTPYGGISFGYVYCHRPASPITNDYAALNYGGRNIALQVGATYKIMKKLGINAEVKANDMKLHMTYGSFARYSLSMMAGLRYRF